MKIAVCIKQVPDTTDVRINPETNTLIREGVESIINPVDLHAVEEAVRIRECLPESEVCVVSMGPGQVQHALREAMSIGVYEALLLSDPAFAGADTWSTSLTLAALFQQLQPDLVLTGKQAIDGDTAQVGPGIAAHLNWPQACYVTAVRELTEKRAVVERVMDHGREVLEIELPAVLTVAQGLNEPRLPTLKDKLRAQRAPIRCVGLDDIDADPNEVGLEGSPTRVARIFAPPKRQAGEILQGNTPDEVAGTLLSRLSANDVLPRPLQPRHRHECMS